MLKGTLHRNKIPGAFLFIGEPFIGKTTTAIEYVKALLCYNTKNDSCDNCIACKKIEKGIHPDIKIIKPDKEIIPIETIREVEEFLSLQPLEGKYKAVIIKNSEKMNRAAANAFLKTLEEPPSNNVIILTCENTDSLPEPLISRTFKIYFNPLSTEAIKKLIPHQDNYEELIRLSMGRPGIFESFDLVKKINFFIDSLQIKKIKKSPWRDNEELKWWLEFLFIVIRDQICLKIRGTENYSHLPIKFRDNLLLEDLFAIYDRLLEIRKNIDLNLNRAIVWNYISKTLRRVINE